MSMSSRFSGRPCADLCITGMARYYWHSAQGCGSYVHRASGSRLSESRGDKGCDKIMRDGGGSVPRLTSSRQPAHIIRSQGGVCKLSTCAHIRSLSFQICSPYTSCLSLSEDVLGVHANSTIASHTQHLAATERHIDQAVIMFDFIPNTLT